MRVNNVRLMLKDHKWILKKVYRMHGGEFKNNEHTMYLNLGWRPRNDKYFACIKPRQERNRCPYFTGSQECTYPLNPSFVNCIMGRNMVKQEIKDAIFKK